MLRATTACTFSTSQLPKVVRQWCVLYILPSKCASRHNGVQIFISHLASWLRTRRFSEPTFRPSGATNHWKNTVCVSRLSYLFAHLHLLSSDSFSSDLLSSNLSLLSASALLCFSSVHIVGSLTSKLPSIRFWKASGFVCKPWVFEQTLQKLCFWICKVYIYLSLYLSVCLSVYLSVYVSTHLFLYLSWCLTICLCVHVSICLSRHLFL